VVAAPLGVGDDGVGPDGQAGTGEDDLHVVLVHARRGREHPGADVADVGELEHALQRAVLAVGAVEQREDDVDLTEGLERLSGPVDREGGLAHPRGQDHLGTGVGDLGRTRGRQGQRVRVVRSEHPGSLRRDADGHDVVGVPVDRPEHPGCGGARDGVLGGPAAEDDGDAGLAAGTAAHRGETNV